MRASSTIWRALAAARSANLADGGEAPPVAAPAGATRRHLLKGIAAAAAAPLLPRPAQAFSGGQVAIVGGGIAGLSALHHLREAGVDARLFEARGRLGGRMFTHRPAGTGPFELGGQLVNTDHEDVHALCRRVGVALVDRKAEPHGTLVLDGTPLHPAALAEGLRPIAAQITADADRLDANFAAAASAFDRLSIADYLDRHARLLGPPWVRRLLEATSRTEYGVEPEQASAIELLFNLPTVEGQRVEILGESDERHVIEGGSSTLIDALAERHAGRIALGKRLGSIARDRGGVQLRFLDGSSVPAERVILAVPAPILRQIDYRLPLPALWRAFVATIGLGRNEKLLAAAAAAPWRDSIGSGGELWQAGVEQGWSLGWDGSVHGPRGTVPMWTWFLGGDDVGLAEGHAPARLAERFAKSAAPAIAGLEHAATGRFAHTNWHAQALTLGAYVNFRPGQLTHFAPLLCIESEDPAERQLPQAGAIHFAGEHLSDAFPGYMNGAAQTGRVAAQAIVDSFGAARAA